MNDTEVHYRKDSPIGKNKEAVTTLVKGHWSYMENVLNSVDNSERMFSWDEVMKMRKWDYCSAFIHGFGHGVEHASNGEATRIAFADAIGRQQEWSLETFGDVFRPKGLLDHIKKELVEIADDPKETEEWVDIIILAMEGAWRSGATPEEVVQIFGLKMTKNERRDWPAIGSVDPDKAIEHVTEGEKLPFLG